MGSIVLYVAAAIATAIAGMLHLMMGPNALGFNVNQGILFIVGGIAQIFWIIPMVRRWGIPWYAIGIGGTIVFMAIWIITRVPGNPITGRGGPADNPIAIAIEVLQGAFIGLAAAIILYERRGKKQLQSQEEKATPEKTKSNGKARLPILAGAVVALILIGLFALPILMPSPMSGGRPPGQGGPPPSAAGQFGPPPEQFSATQANASTNKTCTLTPSLLEVEGTPQQTEGPYFVDNMPNRSDIRSDTSDGSVQEGIPLDLVINVYDVDGGSAGGDAPGSCIPLKGALVDIWHANPQGIYSGVQQQGTSGHNFLRGNQVTDDNGTVRFITVYPGWYEGRAIHIHVKVRTFEGSNKTFEWTSQFYLNNSISEQVHTQPPYSDHGQPDLTNEEDAIYTGASTDGLIQNNAGQHLMLNLTHDQNDQGYLATFNVVVNANQIG
jgi:protocatechuate 3,4-dioxygenase beta subunit